MGQPGSRKHSGVYRLARAFYRAVLTRLPKNRAGDYLFSLLLFVRVHRRLPKRTGGGFADALFYLKTSSYLADPLRVLVSDKEFAKDYVTARVGDRYNVPTSAILRSPAAVRDFAFPADCIIKPTHMSGEVIYRRGGAAVDLERIERWFDQNLYDVGRGLNYKPLRPKVIVEPLVFDSADNADYKILCVGGEPKVILVDVDRRVGHKGSIYTPDWELLPFGIAIPHAGPMRRPGNLDEMLSVASALSRDFTIIRVDLYSNGTTLYVGELTNCHGNACEDANPASARQALARLLFGPRGFSVAEHLLKRRSPDPVAQWAGVVQGWLLGYGSVFF